MGRRVVELYSDDDLERLHRKISGWTWALVAVAALALGACIAMAATAGTANAGTMEICAIAVSVLAGWFVIYCSTFVVTAASRELNHAVMLKTEELQRIEGTVTVTRDRLPIRRSITARRIVLHNPDADLKLLVVDSCAGALTVHGIRAVYTAHGYVAAYEVER